MSLAVVASGFSSLDSLLASFSFPSLQLWNAFESFAHVAAPAAVAALWQGAAVAAALAVCLQMAPRVPAAHRFAAWAAGFGVVACLPALPRLARLFEGFAASGALEGAPAGGMNGAQPWLLHTRVLHAPLVHPWFHFDARWSLAIAGLWLALSALRAADLATHSFQLRRLWRSARVIEDGLVSSAASPLPAGRKVEICATSELDRPSVIGFFAPRILIPAWLLDRLTREELEQVILHEAEHLRRGDDWTNLLQKLCLVVFPLNPALAWMERRLQKEREMACDEGVVRVTGAPRAYAACLASLAERGLEKRAAGGFARRAEALSLGAFERRPELVHRVHSILFGQKRLSPLVGRALVGVVGCGLVFGTVELARCPQMVAFVPARNAAPLAAATEMAEAARVVPVNYAVARDGMGFRAINAVAIAPASMNRAAGDFASTSVDERRAEVAPMRNTNSADLEKPTADAGMLKAALLKAEMRSAKAANTQAPQEWLVVTAWQVQTATFKAENVADYDTGAANSADSPGAKSEPASGIAAARMFLGVYRASQTAQAATQVAGKTAQQPTASDLKAVPNQSTIRPLGTHPFGARPLSVVPFGDGWLVIEL